MHPKDASLLVFMVFFGTLGFFNIDESKMVQTLIKPSTSRSQKNGTKTYSIYTRAHPSPHAAKKVSKKFQRQRKRRANKLIARPPPFPPPTSPFFS
jgi:hypothetical protein